VSLYDDCPSLRLVLDKKVMKPLLQEGLKKIYPSYEVKAYDIAQVKYEPKKSSLISSRLTIKDKSTRKCWKEKATIQLLNENESYNETATFSIKHPKCLVFLYPNDPVLTWIPEMERHWEGKSTLLAYTPCMRATYLCEVDGKPLIAKTNAFKPPHQVYANYWALWQAGNDRILMPKPVGFLSSPPVTFQEKVEGTRLGAIVERSDLGKLLVQLAMRLSDLHHLTIPLTSQRKFKQEARNLNRWADALIGLCPEQESRIDTLRLQILTELECRFFAQGPIHADFHHTNVLVEGSKITLIDMDDVTFGDPCQDVGRLISSLRIPSLRTFGSFSALEDSREQFVDTYLSHTNQKMENIRLYEAASLLTSAVSGFRFQRPEWKEEVDLLLRESESAFQKAKLKTRIKHDVSAFLSIESRLKWAQDEEYLKALLSESIQGIDHVIVKDVKKKYSQTQISIEVKCEQKILNLGLLLHHRRSLKGLHQYFRDLQKVAPDLPLPHAVCYLQSLGGVVYHLRRSTNIDWAQFAISLAALHRLSVDTVSAEIIDEGGGYALMHYNGAFPYKKYIACPLRDVSVIIKKARFQRAILEESLQEFLQTYAETTGINVSEILNLGCVKKSFRR